VSPSPLQASATAGLIPAASLTAGERCRFNFGDDPFKFCPPPGHHSLQPPAPSSSWFDKTLGATRVAWALYHRPPAVSPASPSEAGEEEEEEHAGAGVLPLTVVRQALRHDATTHSCQVLIPGRIRLSASRVGRSFRVRSSVDDSVWVDHSTRCEQGPLVGLYHTRLK
jgi:hypothetical protein